MDEFDGARRAKDGVDRAKDRVTGSTGRATETTRVHQATDWDRVTRRYHRGPGGWWWLALLAVPLLLAALGLGTKDKDVTATGTVSSPVPSATVTTTTDAPSATTPAGSATAAGPNPFSITRAGEEITVTGVVPDEAAKTALVEAVKAQAGDVRVIDKVTVTAGSVAPEAAAVTSALAAVAPKAGDYAVDYRDQTVTLRGQVPTEADKTAAGEAAKQSWPQATIDNQLTVGAVGTATTAPSGTATEAGAACATLGTDIKAIIDRTKPTFANNGTQLTAAGVQVVREVAAKVKACPDAKLTVTGYTDNNGNDQINQPLSDGRAAAVKKVLVDEGVPAANVTSSGKGSADPIASNDTPEGMAQNRRVEITVS